MCLIGVAIDGPGPWLLVVAANRDEFHDRPTAPAAWWPPRAGEQGDSDRQNGAILAGRDLRGGGTWLGLSRSARGESIRVAALTNMRPGLIPERALAAHSVPVPAAIPAPLPSRGHLVTGFLAADSSTEVFIQGLEPPSEAYAGFNLMALTLQSRGTSAASIDAWYLNNLPNTPAQRLGRGIHLVSNATLGVPWSKTVRLRASLRAALESATRAEALQTLLFAALDDRTPAADDDLPRTGLDFERERLLSAPFIVDDTYGTRCSTLIIVTRHGDSVFCERSFDRRGRQVGMVTERFAFGAAS